MLILSIVKANARYKWNPSIFVNDFISSLVPFGAFWMETKLKEKASHTPSILRLDRIFYFES